MTYFPAVQYHRRLGLNCCVRDGNRCYTKPVVTDNPADSRFRESAGLEPDGPNAGTNGRRERYAFGGTLPK